MNQDLIKALQTTITAQADLIAHLKAELDRLKSSQINITTPISTLPYTQPTYPYPSPNTTPPWPLAPHWQSPFVYTTSGEQSKENSEIQSTTATTLPLGSVQSGSSRINTNLVTLTNSILTTPTKNSVETQSLM